MSRRFVLPFLAALSLAASAWADPDPGWPRVFRKEGRQRTVYQPQVDDWRGFTKIHFRCAIAVRGVLAAERFGVAEIDAVTVTDQAARMVAHGASYQAYGPYGGAGYSAGYNPSTGTFARSSYAYGPYGSASRAAAYNPTTGQGAAGGYVSGQSGSAGAVTTTGGPSAAAWTTQQGQRASPFQGSAAGSSGGRSGGGRR